MDCLGIIHSKLKQWTVFTQYLFIVWFAFIDSISYHIDMFDQQIYLYIIPKFLIEIQFTVQTNTALSTIKCIFVYFMYFHTRSGSYKLQSIIVLRNLKFLHWKWVLKMIQCLHFYRWTILPRKATSFAQVMHLLANNESKLIFVFILILTETCC